MTQSTQTTTPAAAPEHTPTIGLIFGCLIAGILAWAFVEWRISDGKFNLQIAGLSLFLLGASAYTAYQVAAKAINEFRHAAVAGAMFMGLVSIGVFVLCALRGWGFFMRTSF